MNLPNKLTVGRMIAAVIYVITYMMKWYWVALIIFILASLTDMLDGQIARRRNLVTNFGKIMDPLADKILVYSALVLMVVDTTVPGWMLIVILAREFVVSGMRTVAASEGIVVAAAMSGKIKTVLQMFAVIVLIVANAMPDVKAIMVVGQVLLWLSLIMTVYSGYEYISKNRSVFSMKEPE